MAVALVMVHFLISIRNICTPLAHVGRLRRIATLFVLLAATPVALAKMSFDASKASSIAHFRAIPIYSEGSGGVTFTRHIAQTSDGYLLTSGGKGVLRYDGYGFERIGLIDRPKKSTNAIAYLHRSKDGQLWIGNRGLYKYNEALDAFKLVPGTEVALIKDIVDDGQGHLWLGTAGRGLYKFTMATNVFESEQAFNENPVAPKTTESLAWDERSKELWVHGDEGVFKYSTETSALHRISTPVDDYMSTFIRRDMALDTSKGYLWIGTSRGLIRVDTKTHRVKMYTSSSKPHSLPIDNVNVTFIDSAGNLWVGLEKEGICVYRQVQDDFLCKKASVSGEYDLPVATVEDIFEDDKGSLWLSMNHDGAVRLTPDLEKFKSMRSGFSQPAFDYFPRSYDPLALDNGEVWVATDGGGINIYNRKTGEFKNLKHDPENPNSLPSNSVISLTQDENGHIWAGMWAGGLSKINPETLEFTHYQFDPAASEDATLGGDNIFVVLSDQQGGIWISIWERGIQYFRPEENTYKNYYADKKSSEGIHSGNVTHFTFFENKLWITGEGGLDVLDLETDKFDAVSENTEGVYTFVQISSQENIYIGTRVGLLQYNHVTREKRIFNVEDGLPSNEVYYLFKDHLQRLWVATSHGLSIFDESSETFNNFYMKDGLVGDLLGSHGHALYIDGEIYFPGVDGVTIIDPEDLPQRDRASRVYIDAAISVLSANNGQGAELDRKSFESESTLPHHWNYLRFKFSMLNFIFPENNRFKYRLKGLQSEFTESNASTRHVTYNSLPPGTYTFEVFGEKLNGEWSEHGDSLTFTILPPWYKTWWALTLFVVLSLLLIYVTMRWRVSLLAAREKWLEQKVVEKTEQLNEYARDLKEASDSLSLLNSELESRVEQRTKELKVEIGERKLAQSKLFYMAFHDELTGLPNRQWTINHIEKLVSQCQQDHSLNFGIMFLDGDRFKQVNDTHGHLIGDQLLIASATRLSQLLSDNQHVSRLGGDEFTVILDSVSEEGELKHLATKIIDAFNKPFVFENNTIYFNVSVGILKCDMTYAAAPSVLRDADIAMYRAKEAGRGVLRVFDSEMRETCLENAELESSIRQALDNEEFYLAYQPIIDLRSSTVSGFEALLRWNHPTKGNIPPSVFIPVAEETGIISEIGRWILRKACSQTQAWHELNHSVKPKISVNVSSMQLRNADFLSHVDEALVISGLPSEYLILELTESMLIEVDDGVSKLLDAFYERQIDLAIDDFGTGYSSLSYLSELQVQHIKIDRRFVNAIDETAERQVNLEALEIVKAVNSLGQGLQKKVTAEGIETQTQLQALLDCKCDFGQGFHISKPLSPELAENYLLSDSVNLREFSGVDKPTALEAYRGRVNQKVQRRRDS